MKRKHTLTALATLTLTLGLALTGCGSADEDTKVASGGGAQPTGDASSAPASLSRDEMGVKFAQCLRENGLDVPDPEPGKGVALKFDGRQSKQTVDKAMEACRQYDPQQQGGASVDPQMEENGRKYAVCMRANGVEAFPDPKPGQRGILIDKKVGDDPDFQKAQEACQSILSGGTTNGGN